MKSALGALALLLLGLAGCATEPDVEAALPQTEADTTPVDVLHARAAYSAQLYDEPESLVDRSLQIESSFHPGFHHGPYWGLMQIRLDTARGLGYRGTARGLLDADTNLKYGVAYLSNAYLVSGGDPDRALALYAGGYYYEARRKGLLDKLRRVADE